jgi:sortase (surface protein transpeptidase)
MGLPQLRTFATFAASVAIVVAATLGIIIGAPTSVAVQSVRIVAKPTPKAVVTLETPRPAPAPAYRADECPQMTNPGGRIQWIPSANSGPWATDGTVTVPALGTRAPVVRVGVDPTGQMVVPPGAGKVAWLDQGGIPGRTNNMVLAGHISWSGVPGAFKHIGSLKPGDMVDFTIGGKRMVFRVTWACSFVRSSPDAPRIMGYTTVPSVTLITCGGGWDSYAGTHTNRIAVRAELVGEQPA